MLFNYFSTVEQLQLNHSIILHSFFLSFQSCSMLWRSLAISKALDSNHCNIRTWLWWQSNPEITPKRQHAEFCIQAQFPLFCTILNLCSSLHVSISSCSTPFLTTCPLLQAIKTGPLLQAIKHFFVGLLIPDTSLQTLNLKISTIIRQIMAEC